MDRKSGEHRPVDPHARERRFQGCAYTVSMGQLLLLRSTRPTARSLTGWGDPASNRIGRLLTSEDGVRKAGV